MPAHLSVAARPATPFHVAPAPPSNYAPIPQRLITDLHDTPLAIGLYALVGRLFLIVQAPIPLSVPDVMRYDSTLSRGALIRAFNRLLDGGWLIETKERGRKTRYVPTWGRVRGALQPWQMDLPCLGRPRHISRLPLDRSLLDICMGKLTPHPVQTAPVTRYVTTPVLSLTDVGCYVLTLEGLPHETPALRSLGAVRNGQPYPLPDEQQLLARISQRTLALDDAQGGRCEAELTFSGTRRLGLTPLTAPSDADSRTHPLFFVPPGMIGSMIRPMIGSMIGQDAENDLGLAAPVSAETRSDVRPAGITWEEGDQGDSGNPPLSPPRTTNTAGSDGDGADIQNGQNRRPTRIARRDDAQEHQIIPPIPDTDATRILKTINVLPEQLIELADMPIEAVNAAIADGRAREGVRELAGWVVKLLRNHRNYGWTITPPPPRSDSPEALHEAFARYTAEQEDELDITMEAGPPLEQSPVLVTGEPPDRLMRLWQDVRDAMQTQTTRQEFTAWIRCADLLSIERGVATITVPNALQKETIESRYLAALRDLLRSRVGEPIEVRVILSRGMSAEAAGSVASVRPQLPSPMPVTSPAPHLIRAAAAEPEDRPPWLCAERWQALPTMFRAALIGSVLVDGAVQAKSPYLKRLLETRYSCELDELIAMLR
jgi:hypothetical protein